MTKRKLSKIIIIILFFSIFLFILLIESEESNEESLNEEKDIKEVEVINLIEEEYVAEKEEIVEITEKKPIEKKSYNDAIPYNKKIEGQIVDCIYKRDGIPSPKGIAFSPDGEEFWVVSLMNNNSGVLVFETETGKHLKDIVLPQGGGVEIIFNKNGSKAYVSQMETARIFEIDGKTKNILRTFETKSTWTKVIALSHDEKTLYASNWVGNNISVIDLTSGLLLYNLKSVTTPRGIYPTKDGQYIYIAGFENGEIQKINLETKESKIIYTSNGAMRHVVADEEKGLLYFSDMANQAIYKLEMINDSVSKFAQTEYNPNTIELTEDKSVLIVSNRGINNSQSYYIPGPEWGTILFFDTSNGKMLDAIIGGNQPTGLAVNKDKFIYSNFLDGNLVLCNLPSYDEFLLGNGGSSDSYKSFVRK